MTRQPPADFDSVLEVCLTGMQAGRLTLEECLARYREHTARLEPLLRAAKPIFSIPRLSIRPAARDAIEARLRARMQARPAPRVTPRRASLRPMQWLAALAVSTALAVVIGANVIAASSASLPGDVLYPLKRWSESAAVQFSGDTLRFDLHLEAAQRRLGEFVALNSRGVVETALLEEFAVEAHAAIRSADVLAEPTRGTALNRVADATGTAIDLAQSVSARLPEDARRDFDAALVQLTDVRATALSNPPPPPATEPAAIATLVEPAFTPTPSPSDTPRPTPPGQGTPGSGLTKTPSGQGTPASGLTKTPSGQGTPRGGLTRTPRPTPPGQGTPGGGSNQPPGQDPNPAHEPKPTKQK